MVALLSCTWLCVKPRDSFRIGLQEEQHEAIVEGCANPTRVAGLGQEDRPQRHEADDGGKPEGAPRNVPGLVCVKTRRRPLLFHCVWRVVSGFGPYGLGSNGKTR